MAELEGLRDPLVVAAFAGWNDAGSAATAALAQLAEAVHAAPVFELDPDDFYDYQVNRPEISIANNGDRTLTWPTTSFAAGELADGRDVLLIQGIEPNMRWREFCRLIVSALRSAEPIQVILLGALLADTPHTRPVPVTCTTTDARLMEKFGIAESTYEGPTGIVGVLADQITRASLSTLSVWAAVPHYVSQSPCPKASLALLAELERLVDSKFDPGELPELSAAWERSVNELAADDNDVAEYVTQLEQQADTTVLPEASGEAIAAEFERYLRRRQGN